MVVEETDWTGKTLGNYQILRKLGAGGMATVYKAHEMSLNRVVALKVISRQLSEDTSFIERFKREAQAAAQINHPNIVQIYSISQEDDVHFFAMEYVKGESLQDVIRREGFLTAARAVPIIRQTAEALSVAHEAGIVHRDIKPANIMLDEVGRVKVADFGIAQMDTRTRLTRAGFLVGTPEYISPEQCRGEQLDGRSDIYSLGVTFYQTLSGTTPFEADTPAALVLQIIEGNFAPVQELNPTVPVDIQKLLAQMMHPDKNQRFQSAEDVVAVIQDIEDEPARMAPATAVASRAAAPADATEVAGEGGAATVEPTVAMPDETPPAPTAEPTVAAPPAEQPPAEATVAMSDTGPAEAAEPVEAPPPPTAPEEPAAVAEETPSAPAAAPAEAEPPVPDEERPPAVPPPAPARGKRGLFIGVAAVVVIVIGAIGAWQLLGPSGSQELGEAVDDPSKRLMVDASSETAAEVEDPVAAEAEPGAVAGARPEEQAPTDATGPPVAQVQDPPAAETEAVAGAQPERQPMTEPATPAAAPPREAVEQPAEERIMVVVPPENSVVATIEGEYEYVETVIAYAEQVFGREGFLVIDWPSSPARAMEEAARFHIVMSARLQGTQELEYYGRTQTQYTVALSARAVDLSSGAVFAGPRTETVRYTSVNQEQNLREAATKLARDLCRELKDKAGLGR